MKMKKYIRYIIVKKIDFEAIKKSEELRNQGYIVDLLPKEDIKEIKIVKGGEL